ncbi:hypothetical protein CP533_2068 [Ophiocordyceps camponoti-saundersi (nom. inval.)]|nr:hypothetical protein CP533_2068 [Ophiocordyceps camponoti-saundersi (nom. inval.)]
MTEQNEPNPAETSTTSQKPSNEVPAPLSKNALKRLRKQEEWEQGRESRRKRRREKRIDRRQRRREEKRVCAVAADNNDGDDGEDDDAAVAPSVAGTDNHQEQMVVTAENKKRMKKQQITMPVAIVVDCDFESYMTDKERVSLASQLTRCYSANRQATCRAHLCMAGWQGKIRHRFRDVLGDQQRHWKGVAFVEGDYLVCADEARRRMTEQSPASSLDGPLAQSDSPAWVKDDQEDDGSAPPLDEANTDVVYLTSESPYTLQRLEPNTVYVVGGLVDRNREKGLCYRRAREKGIRTARLPITQFMRMQSRRVLATNHVVEILLRWLECGNWGDAFLAVIPKRKGGSLIRDDDGQSSVRDEDDDHNEGCKEETLKE